MRRTRPGLARMLFLTMLTIALLASMQRHAIAQTPADYISGSLSGSATGGDGPLNTVIKVVPAGKTFVLTDLDYSVIWGNDQFAGNRVEGPLTLMQGMTERWSTFISGFTNVATGTEARDMLSKSFSTGIAFPAGTSATLIHQPWQNSIGGQQINWRLSWSGYLYTNTITGVLPQAPGSELQLGNATPNPLEESTRIAFALSKESRITLRIVDVRGRVVRTLLDGPTPAGAHDLTWDARDSRGRSVNSGVYFIELLAGNERQSRKAVVIN